MVYNTALATLAQKTQPKHSINIFKGTKVSLTQITGQQIPIIEVAQSMYYMAASTFIKENVYNLKYAVFGAYSF